MAAENNGNKIQNKNNKNNKNNNVPDAPVKRSRGRPRKDGSPAQPRQKTETIRDVVVKYPSHQEPVWNNTHNRTTNYDMTLSPDEIVTRDIDRHLEMMELPVINTDDPDAVRQRFGEYFAICRKYGKRPTVGGFAESLAVSRQTLWYWLTGERKKSKEVVAVLEVAYAAINAELEDLLISNKINPVSGIFLLKQSGYKDTQDVVFRNDSREEKTEEQLEEEYLSSIPVVDD